MGSRPKWLVWGFALMTVVSLGLLTLPFVVGQADVELTVTVPVGHLGDLVGYSGAIMWNEEGDDGTLNVMTNEGNDGFRVADLTTCLDETGHQRRVVRLETAAGVDGAWGADVGPVEYVDLETRSLVRADLDLGAVRAWHGPTFPWWYDGYHHGFLAFQGDSLEVGDDLTDRLPSKRFQFEMWDLISFEERVWVSGKALVDGEPAWVVEHDVNAVGEYAERSGGYSIENWTQHGQDLLTASSPYPRVSTLEISESWLDPSDPTAAWTPPDTYATEFHLALYEAGDGPEIPWSERRGEEVTPARADLQRSGASVRHPTDGEGVAWSYRLQDAMVSVENDATLAEFADWRARHPQAVLVGARFMEEDPAGMAGGGSDRWLLVYGRPPDALFAVESSRADLLPIAANRELGEHVAPDDFHFQDEDLPWDPVTFGAALGLWDAFVGGGQAGDAPRTVAWGYHWFALGQPDVAPSLGPGSVAQDWFDRIEMATSDGAGGAESRQLVVEASTGHVMMASASGASVYETDRSLAAGGPEVRSLGELGGLVYEIRPLAATTLGLAILGLLTTMVWYVRDALASLLLGMPGFSKLREDQLLDHPLRKTIHHQVEHTPGVSAMELSRTIGGPWSTLIHHLHVLERHQRIVSVIDGRHRRFFLASVPPDERPAAATLRNARTRAVFDAIRRSPGVHQKSLADRFKMTSEGVSWHVRRLERNGLVERHRDGRWVRFQASG